MTSKGLIFPTAEEASYPITLCKRVAAILAQFAISRGASHPINLEQQLKQQSSTSHPWILDMLPRGKKFKPLVSEFSSYIHVLVKTFQDVEQSDFFKQQLKGTKLTTRRLQVGCVRVVNGASKVWKKTKHPNVGNLAGVQKALPWRSGSKRSYALWVYPEILGTLWEELWKWVTLGVWLFNLSEGVERMPVKNFCEPPHVVVESRAKFLEKWTSRCKELQEAETEMQEGLDKHVREVLKGKRLILLGEILSSLKYPDHNLVEDLKNGFQLTGWIPKSGVFPNL